jgi:hypothetical protein
MACFVPNYEGLKVKTATGYMDFSGIAYMGDKPIYRVGFDNKSWIEVSIDHKFTKENGEDILISDVKIGDTILAEEGNTCITDIIDTGKIEPVYDLIDVDGNHYYTNGVLSHNCEFLTAEETLVSSLKLINLKGREPSFNHDLIRWYSEPQPNRVYLIGLDPAAGTGGERAAIQVYQLPEMKQIAEWCDNMSPPKVQIENLIKILRYIRDRLKSSPIQTEEPENAIYWTFENNGVGEAINALITEQGEEKFPGVFISEPKRAGIRTGRRGLTTSQKPKMAACIKLKSMVETDKLEIASKAFVIELKNYIRKGVGYEHKNGNTDDLVSATLLTIRLAGIISNFDPNMTERLKEVLELEEETSAPLPFIMLTSF